MNEAQKHGNNSNFFKKNWRVESFIYKPDVGGEVGGGG